MRLKNSFFFFKYFRKRIVSDTDLTEFFVLNSSLLYLKAVLAVCCLSGFTLILYDDDDNDRLSVADR